MYIFSYCLGSPIQCTLYTKLFINFVIYLLVFISVLLTESDILALATRVQKSLKDDGASAGINNVTIIIAMHVQTHVLYL